MICKLVLLSINTRHDINLSASKYKCNFHRKKTLTCCAIDK